MWGIVKKKLKLLEKKRVNESQQMKITRKQLRQIIKEEFVRFNESAGYIDSSNVKSVISSDGVDAAIELIVKHLANIDAKVEELQDDAGLI